MKKVQPYQPNQPASELNGIRVLVVLPAFNEEANLARLLNRIEDHMTEEKLNFRIVVVDDGSSDRTPSILENYSSRLPLSVQTHKNNQGLGPALRDGFLAAVDLATTNDIIVTMDADETHAPKLILEMANRIAQGSDVIIASRYVAGARVYGVSWHRRFISWLGSRVVGALFPTAGVSDYTCGYRAYRAQVLKQAFDKYGDAFVDQQGFQCMLDVLLKLRTMPLVFGEVPITLRYDLKGGQSKMRLIKTSVSTMQLILKRRLGK